MVNSEKLKLQLVRDIINLPNDKLAIVREIIADVTTNSEANDAKASRGVKTRNGKKTGLRTQKAKNPLLALIGCVSYDPPQKSIDEELYGDDPL